MPRRIWSRYVRSLFGSAPHHHTPARPRRRVSLEPLEDRLAPATYIWSGQGTNTNWSTGANWVGGIAPTGNVADLDSLVFPAGAASLTAVNDLPISGTAVPTFNSISLSGSGYTLTGKPLVLGDPSVSGSGSLFVNAGNTSEIIALDVQLGTAAGSRQFFTVNTGADLTITGKLSGSAGGELAKIGQGTLVLAGDNAAFTGPITLDNNGGVLRITTATALGSSTAGTTVSPGSQLQVSNVTGNIAEPLLLNGSGLINDGALAAVAGTGNTWTGTVRLDSDTTLGGLTGTTLTITGVVSDLGAGHNLTKEGLGRVVLTASNSYRGLTTINEGILTAANALALGTGGTPQNATLVNHSPTKTGTLEVQGPVGGGFTILNERLTLNGPGVNGLGALRNVSGDNTWASSVILGSPAPNGSNVSIGAAGGSSLLISGVVSTPNGFNNWSKVDGGRLILNNVNTFSGSVFVGGGALNIRDSRSLNSSNNVAVGFGAALELEIDTGTDAFGRNLGVDSVTGVFNKLRVANPVQIQGTGINNTGALRSVSGINLYTGNVTLSGLGGIGVEPDPFASNSNLYFTNDWSLTVNVLTGTSLAKVGTGHLILPNANFYTGQTQVQQGWVTVQNDQSFGPLGGGSDTIQQQAIVSAGASLMLKPLTAGANFNFLKRVVLAGQGITHPFALISQKGALMSLGGNNTIGGTEFSRKSDIQLNGVAGIGVELLAPDTTSSLTVTASILDFGSANGGITKLGSRLLVLQGDGTYSGANAINEGVLRIQNSSALGVATTGTAATGNNTYTTTSTTVGRGISELQSLTIGGTAGTYTLTFNGQTTGAIASTASATTLAAALNALSSIGGAASVTQSGNVYMVSFRGSLVGFNQPQLVATPAGGTLVTVATLMNGDGAALELGNTVAWLNGGAVTGLGVWHENLTLNSPGNSTFGSAALTMLANDNLWRGGITLTDSATIQVAPSARVSVYGGVADATNPSPSGSNLTLTGGGQLALAGGGTFRGTTFVNQGTLLLQNSTALGASGLSEVQTVTLSGGAGTFTLTFKGATTTPISSSATPADVRAALNALPTIGGVGGSVTVAQNGLAYTVTFGGSLLGFDQPAMFATGLGGTIAVVSTNTQGAGGTVVADGASLELQGSLAISGEPLILSGRGSAQTNSVPVGWFNEGPQPANNWVGAGSQAVGGRVTGVVTDPTDSNVIYLATAASGVWKTTNGGKTWLPLFDLQTGSAEVQAVTVGGTTSGTFTLTFNGATTASLPATATAQQVQQALNALVTVGGASGSVGVTKVGSVYTVTFGGALLGVNVPQLSAAVTGGTTATISTVGDGIAADAAMFVGTITMDNNRYLYAGTGETNNSTDSFYGTGLYRSTDAGVHWTLVSGTQVHSATVKGRTGTFTLTFNGASTSAMPFDAAAGTVQAELNNLSSIIGVGGNVSVNRVGIPEVQRVTVSGTAGTFNLTFNGATTIDLAYNAPQADVQTALNNLSSIGGVGGSVVVTLVGNAYTIAFAGTLGELDQPLMTGTGAGGASVNITQYTQGGVRYDVTLGGSLAASEQPVLVAAGLGGTTASATIRSPFNPFDFKGISKVVADPNSGVLYVASGDGGSGRNEVQQIRPNMILNQTFTLTYTGADGTGAIVTLTTAPITFNNTNGFTRAQMARDIEDALNALANIGGIGGVVSVGVQSGGFGGLRFNITFGGVLSQTNVQQLTANPPPPPGFPSIAVSTTRQGGSGKVVNGTADGAGIWRLQNGIWLNLTSLVSSNRSTIPTIQAVPPTEDANPTSAPNGTDNPPRNPGPDDDYRLEFPQTNATWSDVALVYTDVSNTDGIRSPVLYAALGVSSGDINNGVYWTRTPTAGGDGVIWYAGDPGGAFAEPATAPTEVDAGRTTGFPRGQFAVPNPAPGNPVVPELPLIGNIKLAVFAGPNLNDTTVWASTANPTRSLLNLYRTPDGGLTWNAIATPTYLASHGDYANSILAGPDNLTVVVAGYEVDNASHAQHILITTDANAWTDISTSAGVGPHTGTHALAWDQPSIAGGRLLAGTDGGLWRREGSGSWTDLNGNIASLQVNGVASHPTDPNIIYVGSQSNGTAVATNGLAWAVTDSEGGGQIRVDPKNPRNVYHVQLIRGANAIVKRSTDGGLTWSAVPGLSTDRAVVPLWLDGINTARLLVGGSGLRESITQGSSWRNLNAPLGTVTAVAAAAYQGVFVADGSFTLVNDKGSNTYDADTIYATDGDSIYVTKNHGVSWADRSGDLAGLGGIADIYVDPRNRDVIYAVRNVFGGGTVWRSEDAGRTWTDLTADLPDVPVWKLALDPRNGNLYVGTDRGVYQLPGGSPAGGWKLFGSGMPNVQVRDLELNQNTNTLRAGTYGRGVFTATLADGAANAGALRAVTGNSAWIGPVMLVGDAIGNAVYVAANGTPGQQAGPVNATLDIVGSVRDLTAGSNPRLVKIGLGDVKLSGSNAYGGVTEVVEGALITQNTMALGSETANTVVNAGAVLGVASDLQLEPISLSGDGILSNGHYTGALRNVANNNTYTGVLTLVTDTTIGVDTGSTLTIGSKPSLLGVGTVTDGGANRTLTKELTGTLVLASANTYGGATAVHAGAVRVMHAEALGGTAAGTTVSDGAQVQVESPVGGPAVVVDEPLSLTGTGIFGTGALLNTGGDNTWRGLITLAATPAFAPNTEPPGVVAIGVSDAGDTLTLAASLREALPTGIDKVGTGTLVLGTANAYSGGTTVTAGRVRIRTSLALGTAGFSEVQRVSVGGLSSGTFRLSLNGQTTGVLGFDATSTQVRNAINALGAVQAIGSVAVVKDTVQTGLPGSLYTTNLYTVTFTTNVAGLDVPLMLGIGADGTTAAVSTVADGGVGTLVQNGAALEIDGGVGMTVIGERLWLNGTGPTGAGALVNLTGTNAWTGSVTLQSDTLVRAETGTQLTVVGEVRDPDNPVPVPAADLDKAGAGTLVFTNANPYGGTTTVREGVLGVQNGGALGTTGPEVQTVTITANGTVGQFTLTFNGETTAPLAYDVPASGGVGPTASVQNALNALGTIGGVGGSVTVTQSGAVYTVTFGGTLNRSNVIQIFGVGLAGVDVETATTRDGPEGTVVNAGATLALAGGITVSTEALTLNGTGVNDAGALLNGAGNNTWSGPVTLGSDSTIGVAVAGDTLAINQAIAEAAAGLAVTKVGPGTLSYGGSAENTYTGTTTVTAGTLALNKTGGAVAIQGDLTIGTAAGAAGSAVVRWQQSNQVLDSALVTVLSDGLLDLNGLGETVATLRMLDGLAQTGANGSLGVAALDMAGGTMTLGTGGQLLLGGDVTATSSAAGAATVTGPGTVQLGSTRNFDVADGPQATDLLVASAIAGSAGLVKAGLGTLELDGVNTYAGSTLVDDGTVQVDGTVGDVQLAGGVLTGTGTVGTITGDGTVAPGAGGTGVLTAGGGTVLGPQTTLTVELNDTTPGGGHDQLRVTGNVQLNGAVLNPVVGVNVTIGQPFTVLQTTGGMIAGQFAQGQAMFIDGKKYTIDYSDPTKVVLTRVQASVNLTLTPSVNPAVYGQQVLYTFTVVSESGAVGVTPTAQVRFTLDSTLTQTVAVGTGTVTFDPQALLGGPLSVGSHTLVAAFLGDADFAAKSITLTPGQQVNRADSAVGVSSTPASPEFGDSVTVTVDIDAVAPGGAVAGSLAPGGTVVVTVDGTPRSPLALDASGVASLVLSGLSAGTHTVSVTYAGDGRYNASATAQDYVITLAKATAAIDLIATPTSTARGELATFTALVTPAGSAPGPVTGTVTFYHTAIAAANLIGSQALSNGQASASTAALNPGAYTIFAVYSGSDDFQARSFSVAYSVTPGATRTAVTSSKPLPVFGEAVTFEATVTSVLAVNGTPVGNVVFTIDGNPQPAVALNAQGKASISVSSLSVGQHSIVATFVDPNTPDTNDLYATSSGSLTQQVAQAGTTTALTSLVNPSLAGDAVTYRATVAAQAPGAGVPGGTVTFFVNGIDRGTALLINGAATAPLSFGAAGDYAVTARYNGSAAFTPSTAAPTTQVVQTLSLVAITANPASTPLGELATFTATVTGVSPALVTATGTVAFYYDVVDAANLFATRTLDATGAASASLGNLTLGAHTIYAVYSGDAHFLARTGAAGYAVTAARTTTTVTSSTPAPVFGENVTFEATVASVITSNGTPVGSVMWVVDGVNRATVAVNGLGKATFALSTLSVGAHTIEATYFDPSVPDSRDRWATSTGSLTQTVAKAGTEMTLVSALMPSARNQPVTFTATVAAVAPGAGVPTGTVTFFVGGVSRGTATLNAGGVATLPLTFTTTGTVSVTAAYNGSANYEPTTTAVPVTQPVVPFVATATLVSNANPSVYGQVVTLTATFRGGAFGGTLNRIVPGTATFFVDGVATAPVRINANGQAVLRRSFPVGVRTVVVRYAGSSQYTPATAARGQTTNRAATTVTVSSNRNAAYIGQATVLTAVVRAKAPGGGMPRGTVTFVVGGVSQPPVPLDAAGVARLNVGALPLGNNLVTVVYSGTENHASVRRAYNQQVLKATRLTVSLVGLALVGSPFDLRLVARGNDNSVVPGVAGPARFQVLSAPAGGTVTGPRSVAFDNGVATFGGLVLSRSGVYKLRFFADGLAVDITIDKDGRLT